MTPQTSAKFMRIVAYILIVYSFIWGLAPFESINLPAKILLDILDWPIGDAPAMLDKSSMWLSAIGASLLLAVAIFFLGIVAPALAAGDHKVVNVAIIAIVAWFIMDSVGSVAAGVLSNVFFNMLYLVLILYPMIAAKFHRG